MYNYLKWRNPYTNEWNKVYLSSNEYGSYMVMRKEELNKRYPFGWCIGKYCEGDGLGEIDNRRSIEERFIMETTRDSVRITGENPQWETSPETINYPPEGYFVVDPNKVLSDKLPPNTSIAFIPHNIPYPASAQEIREWVSSLEEICPTRNLVSFEVKDISLKEADALIDFHVKGKKSETISTFTALYLRGEIIDVAYFLGTNIFKGKG